jgi:hypothetical protein
MADFSLLSCIENWHYKKSNGVLSLILQDITTTLLILPLLSPSHWVPVRTGTLLMADLSWNCISWQSELDLLQSLVLLWAATCWPVTSPVPQLWGRPPHRCSLLSSSMPWALILLSPLLLHLISHLLLRLQVTPPYVIPKSLSSFVLFPELDPESIMQPNSWQSSQIPQNYLWSFFFFNVVAWDFPWFYWIRPSCGVALE